MANQRAINYVALFHASEVHLADTLSHSSIKWPWQIMLFLPIILFPYSQDLVLLRFQVVLLFPNIILNFFTLPYLPQKLNYTSLTKSALHAPHGNTGSNKCTLQQAANHTHISVVSRVRVHIIVNANRKPAS